MRGAIDELGSGRELLTRARLEQEIARLAGEDNLLGALYLAQGKMSIDDFYWIYQQGVRL